MIHCGAGRDGAHVFRVFGCYCVLCVCERKMISESLSQLGDLQDSLVHGEWTSEVSLMTMTDRISREIL